MITLAFQLFFAWFNEKPERKIKCNKTVASLMLGGFALQVFVIGSIASSVNFDRAFAPQDGIVSQYEQPVRDEICLNGSWRFQGDH